MFYKLNKINFHFLFLIPIVSSLTAEERSELQRKMKYYHSSVRPSERFNMISSINGTFFELPTEIRVQDIYTEATKLHMDLVLILNYFDERLQMRELKQNLKIPHEFQLWAPSISMDGKYLKDFNSFLDPVNGYVSLIYKIKYDKSHCVYPTWRYPFESYTCSIIIETEDGEHLSLKVNRDMRDDNNNDFFYEAYEWPVLKIEIEIKSYWQSSIAVIYLPSILLFSVALFSQLKRRKVQIHIITNTILCIIFLQSTKLNFHNDRYIVTMQDLWLLGTFIHLISLLAIDLLLPSQHIIYDNIEENSRIKNTIVKADNHMKKHENFIEDKNENNIQILKNEKNIYRDLSFKEKGKQKDSYTDNFNSVHKKNGTGSCYNNLSYEGSPAMLKNIHLEAYPLIIANHPLTKYHLQQEETNFTNNSPYSLNRKNMITNINGQTNLVDETFTIKKGGEKNNKEIKKPLDKIQRHFPKSSKIIYTLSDKKKVAVFSVLCVYIIFVFLYCLVVAGLLQ
uniref:Neur_chan_LBD domain-containing protein n=1 Tax=Parastrongyloides trichosuri TaxID=131310 RepID=A0A0N5A448_PARTI